ncbi:hypothetical protein [Flavobacterium sp. W21_SRS_FM6]|uniref:hypothetical protein n=1 Tax=Flavobacterium sp. W21_SRS_FM6 TaxID=3240268 RepID=UPI003F931F69
MKKLNIRKFLAVVTLFNFIVFNVNATLIKEHWSATVTASTNSSYKVGDNLTWNLLYDNSIGILSVYVYNSPGVENRDTDRRTIKDLSSAAYNASFSLFADAMINFNGLFENMFDALSTSTTGNSIYSIYSDQRWSDMSGNQFIEQYRNNSYFFTNGSSGLATIYTLNTETLERRMQTVEFDTITIQSSNLVEVSEPPMLAWLFLALIVVNVRRCNKFS